MNTDLLNSEILKAGISLNVIYYEETESTNLSAKNILAENPSADNTLILTSHQTHGKGRFDRKWYSEPGANLTFTLIKKLRLSIDEIQLVNFYSSYILCTTLRNIFIENRNMNFMLKWPNDLLLNDKKLSGILLEIKNPEFPVKTFIIGCGVNVNQTVFDKSIPQNTTSLKSESGIIYEPVKILTSFIMNFFGMIKLLNDGKQLISKWKSCTDINGKKIIFRKFADDIPETAVVEDVNPDGALCLRKENGILKKYYSGEITLSV
ncbi:MAG: biotin--[acetyl-CoA-carboxylase] ligase [Ignavibacteria bacterium]|nr:biotin--[acetyl-CoA-carboxylase] ligase [Ignavibacteria bacterium]